MLPAFLTLAKADATIGSPTASVGAELMPLHELSNTLAKADDSVGSPILHRD